MPVEFSASANVLHARHLSLFIAPERTSPGQSGGAPHEATWRSVAAEGSDPFELTAREREVLMSVASGLQTVDIAERLFLSSETVKSHVQNAMGKLDSHTRAHAVAIGLMTEQISWEGDLTLWGCRRLSPSPESRQGPRCEPFRAGLPGGYLNFTSSGDCGPSPEAR